MAVLQRGSMRRANSGCIARPSTVFTLLTLLIVLPQPSRAGSLPLLGKPDPLAATTSRAVRDRAIKSIPMERLDKQAQSKVRSVLANVSIFRRLPTRVAQCDPHLYLFLVEHPDIVVNIWEVLNISELKVRELDSNKFQVEEKTGTLATVEFLYRSPELHILYAEGSYEGPLFPRPMKGKGLLVLRTGYVRETDGRYYITTRLDSFMNVDSTVAELVTKTAHLLMGKIADTNFVQTVAFVGSLSRTAEENATGVKRLATKLTSVRPEHRRHLAKLVDEISQKALVASQSIASRRGEARVASHVDPTGK